MSSLNQKAAWLDQIAESAAYEAVKSFSEVASLKDKPELVKGAILLFIKHMLSALIETSVVENDSKNLTSQEKLLMAKQSYTIMKASIQEAVAQSFDLAFWRLKGEPLDFVCEVKVVNNPNHSKAVN